MIHTRETEFLTVDEMTEFVKHWFGNCPVAPGNMDITKEAVVSLGISPNMLAMMAQSLANEQWTRYDIAQLILQVTKDSRMVAALARHGKVYHGFRLDAARRDLRELHGEAREIVQREVLRRVGNGNH